MSVSEKAMLEEVLNEYVVLEPVPSQKALNRWVRRYPQFRKELTEFTVSWALMEELPPSADVEEVDDETLVLRGMSVVQDRLHRMSARRNTEREGITSLVDEAKRHGLNARQLADKAYLSVKLLAKLNRGLIKSTTIPSEVVERVAAALGRTRDEVCGYLGRPMTLAPGAEYYSEAKPKLREEAEDFFDAVRDDETLAEERRKFWLSLRERRGGASV